MAWRVSTIAIWLMTSLGQLTAASDLEAADLRVYIEEFAPLSYTAEDGSLQGEAIELFTRMANRASLSFEFEMMPFSRGYLNVRSNADACHLSVWKTAEREALFSWVGPLYTDGLAFFALKEAGLKLTSVEDSFDYTTGTALGWATTQKLQAAGHPKLSVVEDNQLNANLLAMGRIDLWIGGLITSPYLARQEGIDVEPVLLLEQVDLSIACNPQVGEDKIDRLQAALDALRTEENEQSDG
ncbi:ABC transporter substrate-binding protein [Labrenzia sp. VG12]|uniref:substrate-binding periplasmic protein n=1 Tax=Labrenzia sp. VG12 TaxID=2021862 RepID=UPI000B8BF782|nr:transporter substrate-binding domain-containing protein [Labrenzia sp. VG12]ASP34507.1 hypothetical protein CHH27_15685 [Labrenzia sp. VG12]